MINNSAFFHALQTIRAERFISLGSVIKYGNVAILIKLECSVMISLQQTSPTKRFIKQMFFRFA